MHGERSTKKKMVIKPFKVKPKIPESFEDDAWHKLKAAVEAVHSERQSKLDALDRCATKAGRPLAEVSVLKPEADFPSPDGRHPLKMAVCRLAE